MVISGHTYTQYADLEGFTEVPDHPENHENIGFLTSNTGPDLLKNQCRTIIGPKAKRHFSFAGPLLVIVGSPLLSSVGPPLTKPSGSAQIQSHDYAQICP